MAAYESPSQHHHPHRHRRCRRRRLASGHTYWIDEKMNVKIHCISLSVSLSHHYSRLQQVGGAKDAEIHRTATGFIFHVLRVFKEVIQVKKTLVSLFNSAFIND